MSSALNNPEGLMCHKRKAAKDLSITFWSDLSMYLPIYLLRNIQFLTFCLLRFVYPNWFHNIILIHFFSCCLIILRSFFILKLWNLLILLLNVFAYGPGDLGSFPGRVIPKTLKMVLDVSLLNTQYYKVGIKGKVEKSWERSGALPYTLV